MCISKVFDGSDAKSGQVATWRVCVCLVGGLHSAIAVRGDLEGRTGRIWSRDWDVAAGP